MYVNPPCYISETFWWLVGSDTFFPREEPARRLTQKWKLTRLATSRPHEFLKTKDFSESLETDLRMIMMRDPGNKVEREVRHGLLKLYCDLYCV